MEKKLNFSEFSPASLKEWSERVEQELKGRSVETLLWEFEPGNKIDPYYVEGNPSDKPNYFFRSGDWKIGQSVNAETPEDFNASAKNALNGGVEDLNVSAKIKSKDDLETALSGIHLNMIGLSVNPNFNATKIWLWLQEIFANEESAIELLKVRMNFDPIGDLCWKIEVKNWESQIRNIALITKYGISGGKPILIDVSRVFEHGGSTVDEMVYGLSLGHEYLVQLMDLGYSIDEASALLHFKFSIGTSYFKEIAKFRGFRKLWGQIVERYEPAHECSKYAFLEGCTSTFLMSAMDQHNNILRSTTAAMSAVIGGADVIEVQRHDIVGKREGDLFSNRIARNILHVVREESFFDKIDDPSEGSYFLEQLELKLNSAAWEEFTDVESGGGFYEKISSDYFPKRIADSLKNQKDLIDRGEKVMIGVNKYVNKDERVVMKDHGHERLSLSTELDLMKNQVLL